VNKSGKGMKISLVLKSLGMWLVFVIMAILNGTFRQFILSPNLGSSIAHIISTFLIISILFGGTFIFLKILHTELDRKELMLIGVFWLILTVLFEFIFGHFVMGHPWEKLLADYNILKGRFWILVLMATLFAPIIIGRIRKA